MNIWCSPYELTPVHIAEGVKYSNKGVLLKFEDETYSLYHPIESLGDVPLSEFMKSLSKRNTLLDKVKEASVSLKDFKTILDKKVKCYYSAPSLKTFLANKESILNDGFDTVKFKVSSVIEVEGMIEALASLPSKYIFDFNGRGLKENFLACSDEVKTFFKENVLYTEDPAKEMESLPYVKIAADFEDYGGVESFNIIKPTAFDHEQSENPEADTVVTSYLDHPLGQIMAARKALDIGVKTDSGLLSHTYYEENKYSGKLVVKGPFLELRSALGVFELLKEEPWELVSKEG